MFCSWNVLRIGSFLYLGHFVFGALLKLGRLEFWDVLRLGSLCIWEVLYFGCFVSRMLCLLTSFLRTLSWNVV
jgi:hypothetical protein